MCELTVNNVIVHSCISNMQVKQLSNDLISLISQLESDFRENENSFKQKIKSELSEVEGYHSKALAIWPIKKLLSNSDKVNPSLIANFSP